MRCGCGCFERFRVSCYEQRAHERQRIKRPLQNEHARANSISSADLRNYGLQTGRERSKVRHRHHGRCHCVCCFTIPPPSKVSGSHVILPGFTNELTTTPMIRHHHCEVLVSTVAFHKCTRVRGGAKRRHNRNS